MSKKYLTEIFYITSQTLPFLMITATFIGLAYTYGHDFAPLYADDSFDLLKLTCAYMP